MVMLLVAAWLLEYDCERLVHVTHCRLQDDAQDMSRHVVVGTCVVLREREVCVDDTLCVEGSRVRSFDLEAVLEELV